MLGVHTALERLDESSWCWVRGHLRPLNFAVVPLMLRVVAVV
jgi:hypothetical protein